MASEIKNVMSNIVDVKGGGNDVVAVLCRVVNCVCSIQYSPVWRCLREELEWSLVDILQATTQAQAVGSEDSPSLCWREGGGGGELEERDA